MPNKSDVSDNVSCASSTRSSHPPLVPAGDFKRATSKAPKTKLAAGGGVHISEPPALQTTVPPSGIGGEHTHNGNVTLTSHGIPQDPGGVDRPRASPAFDGRLKSLFHSPDSSPSDPSPQQESSLQQERRPSPSRAKSSRESSSEKPRRSSSRTRKDGRSAEPSETDVRRTLQDVSNDSGGVSTSGRVVQSSSPRELGPLTICDAKKVFSLLFTQIKEIIDDNSKLVLANLRPFIQSELISSLKSFHQELLTPISKSIQHSNDKLNTHCKDITTAFTNISNLCNSILLQSGSHHKQIKDFGKTIQTLTAKIPEKNASNSCECEFNKITFKEDLEDLSTHLKGEMSKQLESIKREVSAIIGSQDQKLVYAVQDVAARIESLGAEIMALSLDREQAREFSPRSENTLRQNPDQEKSSSIKLETAIPSSSNVMLFGITQEIKNLATAIQEKNHSSISEGTVKAMIAELDEGHRKDFSALSTKLDRLLSQFREDGADVRSELAQLNDRIGSENCSKGLEKEPINRNTYNRPPLSHNTQDNYHAPFEQPSHHSVSEIQKHLWGAVNKLEWPKFSGQGEYDHTEFIDWINTCRAETKVPDKFIQIKLLSILTGVAGLWYKAMRKDHSTEKWDFWKRAITLQYGTSNWMRKKQEAFDKDKFIAGETPVSSWVTRQYKRLRDFEPQLSLQSINFRLLGLMDREVEYAAKTSMGSTKADMSALINVLEDIVDKTRLGRKKFFPKTAMPEKTVAKSAKTKDRTPTLTVYRGLGSGWEQKPWMMTLRLAPGSRVKHTHWVGSKELLTKFSERRPVVRGPQANQLEAGYKA
ncbi:hypothetical protein PTTG_26098 [Puccinia triticina 1-1 BBBD Race 1]|uniref:Uncharacterized protein n=1 Tax=Puccinia triticina (isolate 1-1 / race 1 (BBBD)) TaxID=630390 RepID=A0A180GXI8_PUCT1|nr:hypothetical protein PTTG_26098 [Puccinia triticina 1-1 BBBD Race 1]